MKGGVAGGSYSGKRRWKGLVIDVLGLVFLSMLVPLLFLLGLHNGFHPPGYVPEQRNSPSKSKACDSAQVIDYAKGGVDQSGKSCELKFGSYRLWHEQHREDMKDTMVKRLKDQLFVARAYFPSIGKLPSQDKLSRELRQNIQEVERVLSESTTDVDLPPQ
ncbi:hypothetical protein C1H46_007985 [Malus baccata]|uniref:Galacturonosyltransferase 7 n=1 Tax=Malus baccata TaxID=106549 RepID=A0A540N624_MALBA|nr:hypothetical protein C1H46_007985 [Malus baccata]